MENHKHKSNHNKHESSHKTHIHPESSNHIGTYHKIQKDNSHETKHHPESQIENTDQNIIDYNKFIDFLKKYWWVFLIIIPILITIDIRLLPQELVPLENSARANVENYYKSQIAAQLSSSNPKLGSEQMKSLVEKPWQDMDLML